MLVGLMLTRQFSIILELLLDSRRMMLSTDIPHSGQLNITTSILPSPTWCNISKVKGDTGICCVHSE